MYTLTRAIEAASPHEYETFFDASHAHELPGYASVVPHPMGFRQLVDDKTISSLPSYRALLSALRSVSANGRSYWSSNHAADIPGAPVVLAAAERLAAATEEAVAAALPPREHREPVRSRCTLVVVPRPLVQHWREQLSWHLEPDALDGEIIVDDGCAPGSGARYLGEWLPAERLAQASVLVTSSERLSTEQRLHQLGAATPSALRKSQPQSVMLQARLARLRSMWRLTPRVWRSCAQRWLRGVRSGRACGRRGSRRVTTLLRWQVHWLRVIIDEGHLLGGGAITNTKQLVPRASNACGVRRRGTGGPGGGGGPQHMTTADTDTVDARPHAVERLRRANE